MKMPTQEDNERLKNMPLIPLMISGLDMFYLLAVLQLALRHPGTKNSRAAEVARVFAEELQNKIGEAAPSFRDLCAAGWDASQDV